MSERAESRKLKYQHAIGTIRDMILSNREIAQVLKIRDADTIPVSELADKMFLAPGLIQDWKMSSARGGARTALTLVKAHYEDIDIDYVTSFMPSEENGKKIDAKAVTQSILGFDNRVAKTVDLSALYEACETPPCSPAATVDDEEVQSEDRSPPSKADEDASSPRSPA